jgi:glutamine cyclotransferase
MGTDGSDRLLFYALPDLTTDEPLEKLREVRVYDPVNQRYVTEVNELEYVNGHVFANLWKIDIIIDIDPVTGHILDQIDLSSLYPKELRGAEPEQDCLNGIAYHAKENYLLLTGKRWPKYYKFSDTENTSEL